MDKVNVYVDGEEVSVPARIESGWEAMKVLGLRLGERVALDRREGESDEARLKRRTGGIKFICGWDFAEGDRYVRVDEEEIIRDRFDAIERQDWQPDPEAWKGTE